MSHDRQRVDIQLEHEASAKFHCPECGVESPLHDHAKERIWRHLDAFQFHTYIHARTPRVCCEEHGIKTCQLPWSENKSRFTEMFERLIIDTLQNVKNISVACRQLNLTWDQVYGVMRRAVDRGLERRKMGQIRHLGVDEKAWLKGHKYFTVMVDLEKSTVIDIAKERTQKSLDGLYNSLPDKSLEGVEAVAMDMWPAFLASTIACVQSAREKIVHDRFHCVQMLLKALDKVRQSENRILKHHGNNGLLNSRYALGKNPENLTEKQRKLLDEILTGDLICGKAWALKENFRKLWEQSDEVRAKNHFQHWLNAAEESGIAPIQKVAQSFASRSGQILNWFRHQISTGIVEAINGRIMTIKRLARGHRNFNNLRASILFFLGGLDLHQAPATAHSKP